MRRICICTVGLFLAVAAHGEVTVRALDASSRVLCVGDAVQLQLVLHNAVPVPLDGKIEAALTDFFGQEAARVSKRVSLPAGDDRLITLNPTLERPGYFSVDVVVKSGALEVLRRETVWSVAVFDQDAVVPEDSPFGTYTIGNTKMLADIVPKGFYRDMARAGVRWGTIDTWWSRIEPEEGTYDWTFYEQWFDAARAAGITPIPHLFGIPKWASSEPDREDYWAYPPRDWAVWERFVEDFVWRNQAWLVYLRIWNEPNCGYWQGGPAGYAELVKRAATAAKRVKPDLKIIIEAVANRNLDVVPFFDALDTAGATPYWDILAVHNYWLNSREPPERTPFTKIYRDMVAWRDAHKPAAEIWDTEFGCMADDWGTEWLGVGETRQAQWLARAHVLGFALGMKKMFWFPGYSWPDPTTPPYYNPAGLLRADLSPRPAYVAYHTIADALAPAHYAQTLDLGPERHAFVFRKPDGFVTALWSVDSEDAGELSLRFAPETPVVCTGIMGEKTESRTAADGIFVLRVSENLILLHSPVMPTL